MQNEIKMKRVVVETDADYFLRCFEQKSPQYYLMAFLFSMTLFFLKILKNFQGKVYPFLPAFVCTVGNLMFNLKFNKMESKRNTTQKMRYGIVTNSLANLCHHCNICKYANRKPRSNFNKIMVWHRKWCPAWAAHTKVYGLKKLV